MFNLFNIHVCMLELFRKIAVYLTLKIFFESYTSSFNENLFLESREPVLEDTVDVKAFEFEFKDFLIVFTDL